MSCLRKIRQAAGTRLPEMRFSKCRIIPFQKLHGIFSRAIVPRMISTGKESGSKRFAAKECLAAHTIWALLKLNVWNMFGACCAAACAILDHGGAVSSLHRLPVPTRDTASTGGSWWALQICRFLAAPCVMRKISKATALPSKTEAEDWHIPLRRKYFAHMEFGHPMDWPYRP